MKASKRRFMPLVLGLALLAGMIPAALADTPASTSAARVQVHAVKTVVGLKYTAKKKKFTGTVDYVANEVSPDEIGCAEVRKVTLFKVTRRGSTKLASKVVDYVFSFTFRRVAPGSYQVKVAPVTFSDRYGDLIECSGAKASVRA